MVGTWVGLGNGNLNVLVLLSLLGDCLVSIGWWVKFLQERIPKVLVHVVEHGLWLRLCVLTKMLEKERISNNNFLSLAHKHIFYPISWVEVWVLFYDTQFAKTIGSDTKSCHTPKHGLGV